MESHIAKLKKTLRKHNLVPRVSLLPVPRSGKKRDPGNEVGENRIKAVRVAPRNFVKSYISLPSLRKNHLNGICIDFISRY